MPRTAITDLTTYADKAPTLAQERFADWIIEQVGLTFATKKEEAGFRDGVRLAKALMMRYQASDENKAANAEERAARNAAAAAAPAAEPKPAKKAAAKAAPAAAPAAPAKAAPAKRGRKPAAAATADPTQDAPF
jgi:hypothetical protein